MTFHHAPDASEEASRAKRKAGSPPEGEDARQKRGGSAPPPDSAALELRRQELAEVYAAYDALYRAQLPENQTSDDGHVAVFPEASFLRLVKAGQGSDGCRRLAARLVPRFARRFPQHCAAATDILIGMSQLSMADPEQQATARADALAGLVDVAAAAMAAGAAGQQATIKLVDFCFKQLRRLAATTAATPVTHAAPTSNGELPNGCSSGATDRAVPAAGGKQGEQSLEAHLWPCLELCFTSHFRVVLAALLHALKNPGEPFYAVARQFITARLLSVPAASHSPAGGLASTAAGSNDEMEVDGGSFAAAPAATTTRQPAKQQRGEQQEVKPGTLAARVLGGLQPKEQGWVRAQVERWSKEVDASNSREAFTLLEQLLQHLPAAQVGVTPGWLAASVLPAAPARGVGGAEQQPAEQQQQQQQEQQTPSARGAAADAGRRQSPGSARQRQELQARSDRGRGREQLPSRSQSPESPSQQQQRSLRRVGSSRGFGGPPSAQARGRPRGSPSPAPNRRRSPSPWRTQQRQRSSSPWRTQQRQRSSSPWRRWSPGSDVDPQPGPDGTARRVSGGGGGSSPARRSRRSVDVAGADEGEQQAGSPGFIPRMPLGFPQPGVSPCLASACLYFAGLPRNLEERELRAECSKHSKVECAVRPPNVPGGAFVTFKSVRDASRCYEAMCDALPWRERGSPLRLSFVASQVYPPAAPQRIQQPPNHVWVAGVGSVADEAEVLRCCKEGAIPPPEHLLKVPARRPGLLLVFRDGAVAEAAVAAIRAGRPRILGPPGGPMPGGEPATAGPHLAAHRSGGFPRGPSGELREPLRDSQGGRGAERDRGDRGVLPANGREPRPGGELADLAGRTLWVGQIPPGIREEAVLELFRSHGELAGHKFLRHTGCMFVDFVMLAGAAEARQRLDGHRLAGGCLRVEFKNENQFRGGPGGGPGSRDGRQPLPSVGVGGREGVPLGVAAPRGGDGGRDRRLQHPPFRESIEPPAGLHRGRSGERELPGHSPYTVGVQQAQLDRGGGRSRSREGERAQHAPTLPRPRSSGGLDRPPQARASTPQRQQQQQHQQQGGGSRGGPTDGGGPSRQPPAAEAPPLAAATERRRQRRWEGVPALAAAAAEAPAQHAQPNSEQQQLSRLDSQMSSGAVPAASSLPPAAPPVPPVAARPPPPAAMLLPPGILGGGLPPPPTLPPPPARGMPPPRLVVPAVRPPTLAPPSLPFSPMAPGTQQPPPPSFPPPPTATAAAPPPLPRPQQGPPAWRGSLAKSRAPVCAAVCLDAGQGGAAGGWAAGEPQQWPQVLDVAHRADLQHVCYQMFPAVRPEERAVRRVGAADAAGRSALLDFSQYLRSKKRAGVVALPPLAPAGVQRAMYLVPPSEDVCRQLDVSWQSCTDCLLALVVPLTVQR